MEEKALHGGASGAFLFGKNGDMLRQIIENAAIGMLVAGMDGYVIYSNRAFSRDFRLKADGDDRCRLDNILHETDTSDAAHIAKVFSGTVESYEGEHVANGIDGDPVWASLAVTVLKSEQTGQAMYLIVQIASIVRRKQAEEALATSESRWHFALEAARQGVWDHDSRTRTMFYSPMWRKLRGYAPDEEVDDSQEAWLSRLHPEDRIRIKAVVEQQNDGVDGYDTLEYRERHKDGHYVWILSRGKPIEWDEHGNVVRTLGTDTDISHLKAVEAELAAKKERWKVTLEAIADAIVTVDREGAIIFMNAAAQAMSGWSLKDAAGRAALDVIDLHCADPNICEGFIETCITTGQIQRIDGEALLVSRDQRRRDIRCSASPVVLDNGYVIGAVLVVQDITTSRSLQRQLEYAANHDSLTGLANRAAFESALSKMIESGHLGCLLMIDLDRFKPINDTLGHAAGDKLLKQVGAAMRSSIRRDDLCARIGGDEFAVLLHGCSEADARRVGGKIIEAISRLCVSGAGRTFRLGASAGACLIGPETSRDAAMAEADAACYRAKDAGRGRVVMPSDMVA